MQLQEIPQALNQKLGCSLEQAQRLAKTLNEAVLSEFYIQTGSQLSKEQKEEIRSKVEKGEDPLESLKQYITEEAAVQVLGVAADTVIKEFFDKIDAT